MLLASQALSPLLDFENDISISPSILAACVDADFDHGEYLEQRRRAIQRNLEETEKELEGMRSSISVDDCEPRKKRQKRIILAKRNEDRELEEIKPKDSWWYILYVACPQTHCRRFLKKFRRHFRLPYNEFTGLVERARSENWIPRWTAAKENSIGGIKSSPLKLLVLGSLRYLGRGFTFDDCEEATAISEEVHRVFFTGLLMLEGTFCSSVMLSHQLMPKTLPIIFESSKWLVCLDVLHHLMELT